MSRRSLDLVLSISALVVAVVLAIAGVLLVWGGNYANNTVTDQLSAQNISFPADAAQLPDDLKSYAGQQVTSGQQAKAYSDLIAAHLTEVADGKTYSEVSAAWIASSDDPTTRDPALGAQRQTLFMGETLRGMLLNAYAFSVFGTIAIIAAWVSFIAAALLFVLGILGIVHSRRTSAATTVFAPEIPVAVSPTCTAPRSTRPRGAGRPRC